MNDALFANVDCVRAAIKNKVSFKFEIASKSRNDLHQCLGFISTPSLRCNRYGN